MPTHGPKGDPHKTKSARRKMKMKGSKNLSKRSMRKKKAY